MTFRPAYIPRERMRTVMVFTPGSHRGLNSQPLASTHLLFTKSKCANSPSVTIIDSWPAEVINYCVHGTNHV